MRQILAAMVMILGVSSQAAAADPTLDASSMDAYQASIVALSEPLGPDAARDLILQLGILAEGRVPDGVDKAAFRQEAMAKMMADPQVFLDGLKPYEGMTAQQIMAAAP